MKTKTGLNASQNEREAQREGNEMEIRYENRFTVRMNNNNNENSVKWELKPRQRTQSVSLVFFNPNACPGEFLRNTKFSTKKNENTFIF